MTLSEAARLREELVSQEELQAAKRHLRDLLLVQEESDHFAERNGESWLLEGEVRTVEEELRSLDRVEREDIQQVAGEVFRNEELTRLPSWPRRT